jgi:ribosomal-protein-alanine N-acetyltransferase
LDSAAFDPPYQLASGELIELMVTSGYFAVAEPAGQDGTHTPGLVGYVCADVVGDTGQVIRLAVHPGTKRQGIGSALLNHGLAYCHDHGAHRVLVNTQESNTASLRLYEQFGFRRVGRRIPLLVQEL